MKKIKDFNDFLFEMLFEKEERKFHGITELPFVMSERLVNLLSNINHTIAKKLIDLNNSKEEKKVTMVDLSDKDKSKFALLNSNKAYDNMIGRFQSDDFKIMVPPEDIIDQVKMLPPNSNDHEIWTKNQTHVRIGAFVGKVFPKEFEQGGDPGNDIESFVQAVVAKRKSIEEGGDRFKLVKGEDIKKYYFKGRYDTEAINDKPTSTSLAGSCMRYDYCDEYINFYAQNSDVSLLILFTEDDNKEDKIVGRAIVWELEEPSGRTFMDRIYYRYESDMALFKQYAEKQGWLYKKGQNMDSNTDIVDSKNNTSTWYQMKTLSTFKPTKYFPYMDTMKWFNVTNGYLTNKDDYRNTGDDLIYFLESTSGGFEKTGGHYDPENLPEGNIYVEYYDEVYDEEDLTYCYFGNEYRLPEDAIWINSLDEYATEDYADAYFKYSSIDDGYYEEDDVVYSEYHGDYIKDDNAIKIYSGYDEDSFDDITDTEDYRHISDIGHNVLRYTRNGEQYFFDNYYDPEDYFVRVKAQDDSVGFRRAKAWKHRVWDKDKLYKYKNEWHYDFDGGKTRDKLTGQKRIFDDEKS